MKYLPFLLLALSLAFQLKAQPANCIFKEPTVFINFGTGDVQDLNTGSQYEYRRVGSSCPRDGHYSYTPYTSDCFSGDWLTITEDHTPGDVAGNMMLVNASPNSGTFFTTAVSGLKSGTIYEFSLWMMNLCRPTDKCPFPLLPNITIRLQTASGKIAAQFNTGELVRLNAPHWTAYRAVFTTTQETSLTLTMADNAPGGCGNDFVLDDIAFRECIITKPPVKAAPKTPAVVKKLPVTPRPIPKKVIPAPVIKQPRTSQVSKPQNMRTDTQAVIAPAKPPVFPAPPSVLVTRANPLIQKIETDAGEVRINLYDNGEIDGDTVTVYHNNVLLVAHARLSAKPITFSFAIDAAHPHHELVMVADNLGSIPPNTSLMVITVGHNRYEVFISSNEQKNAKVVFDLKE